MVRPPWAAARALLARPVCRAQAVPAGSGGGFTTNQLLPRVDTSHWVLGGPWDVSVWVGTGPPLSRLRASPKPQICPLDSRLRAWSGYLPPRVEARAMPRDVWGRQRQEAVCGPGTGQGLGKLALGPCSGLGWGWAEGPGSWGVLGSAQEKGILSHLHGEGLSWGPEPHCLRGRLGGECGVGAVGEGGPASEHGPTWPWPLTCLPGPLWGVSSGRESRGVSCWDVRILTLGSRTAPLDGEKHEPGTSGSWGRGP